MIAVLFDPQGRIHEAAPSLASEETEVDLSFPRCRRMSLFVFVTSQGAIST